MKFPEDEFKLLLNFYEKNKENRVKEIKEVGDTTNNYWESPSYLIDTGDKELGGGDELEIPILKAAGEILSKWFNIPLKFSMIYGESSIKIFFKRFH